MNIRFLSGFLFIISCSVLYPQNDDIDRAVALFEDNKQLEAKLEFQTLWARNDQNPIAAYYLGRVAFDEQDYEKSINMFERAIELNANDSKYHSWLGKALSLAAINANLFRQISLANRIRSENEIALGLDQNNIDAMWGLLDFYLAAPGILGGSTKEALLQAAAIVKIDSVDGLLAYGKVYDRSNEVELAKNVYLTGIDRFPGKDLFYMNLASTYYDNEELQAAFLILEKLLIEIPESVRGYYQIGRLASLSGLNLERGEECLRIYLKKESNDKSQELAWAHFRLGLVLEKSGSVYMARLEYEKAIELDAKHKQANEALERLS